MIPFLDQLKLLFGSSGEGRLGPGFSSKRPRAGVSKTKSRDPALEERVRAALGTIAPELASKVTAGWNARMRTTAGVAIASRWEIWLNPALKAISDEEVERTLLHESAHLLAQHRHGRRRLAPHGPEWRLACSDLGIPDEGRTHQLPFESRMMKRRYLLRCTVCGESHARVRRPRGTVACLSCCRLHNRGLYHERYRFIITRLPDALEAC